ncbi:thioredoxin reductase [Rhypophila decipiens]|uniref:Thioredoxin reductase n=1 Tax=Rhypophila decipiens TaxID=261697 RepID=A0AAN6XZA1_9PEZI|nr:thioredoxin reductase [Rhypophila decipiens]
MQLSLTLVLTAIVSLAQSAVLPPPQPEPRQTTGTPQIDYDTVVVGGGPAGLAALSGLARVRRNVLLIDSAEYRNGPTRHMHDVLGFDGVTPAYFRHAARQQLTHYETVSWINGTVTSIVVGDPPKNSYFTISSSNSSSSPSTNITITARKVVLATGLRDIIPSTPGIVENWGKGMFWCPWCDGHEHADQPLGLLGSLDNVPGNVRELVTLNKDLIAFVNGTDTPYYRNLTESKFPKWETYLRLHNVTVDNRTIVSITRLRDGANHTADPSLPTAPEHDLFSIRLEDGTEVQRAGFFCNFPSEQSSKVGQEAGVVLYGGRLGVNPDRGLVTNVNGIYAIGDANSDNTTNVPHALFSGKRTAVFVHVQLAREDADKELNGTAVAVRRDLWDRDLEVEARSLWGAVNGGPEDDITYAGEFDI